MMLCPKARLLNELISTKNHPKPNLTWSQPTTSEFATTYIARVVVFSNVEENFFVYKTF
jgi:hypothetical protein